MCSKKYQMYAAAGGCNDESVCKIQDFCNISNALIFQSDSPAKASRLPLAEFHMMVFGAGGASIDKQTLQAWKNALCCGAEAGDALQETASAAEATRAIARDGDRLAPDNVATKADVALNVRAQLCVSNRRFATAMPSTSIAAA